MDGVNDDPEGARGLERDPRCMGCAPGDEPCASPARRRFRWHDATENALLVNALQRHASVVVQKSLAEGFGLTVAEAMWKRRPVVASAVGGIIDQVVDGETGLLLEDPHDLAGFGAAVDDSSRIASRPSGLAGAREHVATHFLGDRHLRRTPSFLSALLDDSRR